MDYYKKMVIIKGEPQEDIIRCFYDKVSQKHAVTFTKNSTVYYYSYNSLKWLDSSGEIDPNDYKISTAAGTDLFNISRIVIFNDTYYQYLRVFFSDGSHRSYRANELIVAQNMATNTIVKNLVDYYTKISEFTGLKSSDGTNIIKNKFEKMSFIGDNTVLSKYLNSTQPAQKAKDNNPVIFPFGCNLSQVKAVTDAVNNSISVIEGPPGTGKTQTILNIIANVVIRGGSVAVVSNNNSATDNVFEKLEKYGFSYIAAQLGNTDNKEDFIQNKQKVYPDFKDDILPYDKKMITASSILRIQNELLELFKDRNRIAELKQQLSALTTEKKYFDDYFRSTFSDTQIFKSTEKLTADKVLNLWNELQCNAESKRKIGFSFKLKCVLFYHAKYSMLSGSDINQIVPFFQKAFYELKLLELNKEIQDITNRLGNRDMDKLSSELTACSKLLFKAELAERYSNNSQRRTFDIDDLWRNSKDFLREYPIILSTTFSARSSLKDIAYDYVIVDEASQVDLATGALAMSCAQNIVVVGDLMQLPNVIPDKVAVQIAKISDDNNIPDKYRYERHSLLSSVCKVFDKVPRTLLREHYRCHPKIIDFCNRKFYNNQLIIMTQDNGEKDVLKAYVTVEGNHARGHKNERQINEIKQHILPELASNDVGIITPYKAQTSELVKQLQGEIDISTVHKFQGREKDDIIISTVDNEITDFTDNPNMLNVAVSRAKKRLRIVISDNEKNEKTNIGDLVKYIQYNNFEVQKSDLYSVFDMLYKCYEKKRKEYLKNHKHVSEFDSENIMNGLIESVLAAEEFSKLDVVAHQPLNLIICNPHKLNDEETTYAMNPLTHIDFLIYNTIDKSPVLAVEVDGYAFHQEGSRQNERDKLKNAILEKYELPVLRFSTTGSGEEDKLKAKLRELI